MRNRVSVTLYRLHQEFSAGIIVDDVGKAVGIIAAKTVTPTAISPAHEEEQEDNPDVPAAFVPVSAVVSV